ncbi:uncharacterized mitochondrial protein AtMg00810-like [Amaranthus tricolor]|uniref:uncharacterized mitochondrial protein AtMg00810-like n=1 Tax=Amaranthus tricolor TaxID=29722 RepID=UPI0025845C92|nr:uncharacterized mitochondrial protein AtMg00810-like [Amaranthus tricolor]
MKDLGPLNYFLGIAVNRTSTGLFFSQQQYASEILEKAGMSQCNPVATPVATSDKLCANAGSSCDDPTLYRSLAGALQYLTFTRPDISYAVQQVCLYMHDPRIEHMAAIHRILRHVKGTLHYGLQLYRSNISTLLSYTDADWGGCHDTRRSTSAKRQPTVSKSSAGAEYRGVANVVSETCWIRNLLLELHCPITTATLVYCDNISAVYLAGNPVHHQRTKLLEDRRLLLLEGVYKHGKEADSSAKTTVWFNATVFVTTPKSSLNTYPC